MITEELASFPSSIDVRCSTPVYLVQVGVGAPQPQTTIVTRNGHM